MDGWTGRWTGGQTGDQGRRLSSTPRQALGSHQSNRPWIAPTTDCGHLSLPSQGRGQPTTTSSDFPLLERLSRWLSLAGVHAFSSVKSPLTHGLLQQYFPLAGTWLDFLPSACTTPCTDSRGTHVAVCVHSPAPGPECAQAGTPLCPLLPNPLRAQKREHYCSCSQNVKVKSLSLTQLSVSQFAHCSNLENMLSQCIS